MKLFVDDVREPPDNTWVVCRSMKTAIELVSWTISPNGGFIDEISLDHDMGDGEMNGYEFLKHFEKYYYERREAYYSGSLLPPYGRCFPLTHVHSSNEVGKGNMLVVLGKITMYEVLEW